jgi:hypothetical protein
VSDPHPGDVSICIACAAPSFFTATPGGLGRRPATATERVALDNDSLILEARAAIIQMAAEDPAWPSAAPS